MSTQYFTTEFLSQLLIIASHKNIHYINSKSYYLNILHLFICNINFTFLQKWHPINIFQLKNNWLNYVHKEVELD